VTTIEVVDFLKSQLQRHVVQHVFASKVSSRVIWWILSIQWEYEAPLFQREWLTETGRAPMALWQLFDSLIALWQRLDSYDNYSTRLMQCVAVCCSVLQRAAVCCIVLQCVAVLCDNDLTHMTTIRLVWQMFDYPMAPWQLCDWYHNYLTSKEGLPTLQWRRDHNLTDGSITTIWLDQNFEKVGPKIILCSKFWVIDRGGPGRMVPWPLLSW